ncbi:MAG: GAF domain-containing protein [Burkholderiaceae bacterium]
MIVHPAFGQADLTNCERELIHLAGSIQPHGFLLVVSEPKYTILQCSANSPQMLRLGLRPLLGLPLPDLGGNLSERIAKLASNHSLDAPRPLRCHVGSGEIRVDLEGTVHRQSGGGLIVELEVVHSPQAEDATELGIAEQLSAAVQRVGSSSQIGALADATVQVYRELTGYDRVMVYKFDPDGHGKIIAEARDPRLESLLGHHYPASDIPQRARELYIRNRVRVLVDVHYEAVPLEPRLHPLTGRDLDMSLCYLRSMSPLHLQYLKNMGVTATLVVSLIREGRLWGLVAAHHYTPRKLRYGVRMACELLGEVVSTRVAAIENYAHAQVAILVRRLEQRLIEATSTEGDWRLALFRNPRTLLQPLDATGAALYCEDEILTAGEVPSTPELRALRDWIDRGPLHEGIFSCSSISRVEPGLESLTPTASGVIAVKLSAERPDYLMWFRKEQLLSVTWAGDPSKPLTGDSPMDLSPRRSFAAWSELVRGTALPWTSAELALARAFGTALIDIIVQVHAVRLLIAEHQRSSIQATVNSSAEPVVVADMQGRILLTNPACTRLFGSTDGSMEALRCLDDLAQKFSPSSKAMEVFAALQNEHRVWRGELNLELEGRAALPVAMRAEVVPGPSNGILGFVLTFNDLTERARGAAAREHFERAITVAARSALSTDVVDPHEADRLMSAILTSASLAAMDIADATIGPSVASLLGEIEESAKRAAELYGEIRKFSRQSW